MIRFAQRQLTHDLYKKSGTPLRKTIDTRIGSKLRTLQTIELPKLSLNNFNNKRFILDDGVASLPPRHYLLRDAHVSQDIADDPDWGYEKKSPSPTWDELIDNDTIRNSSQIYLSEDRNAQNRATNPPSNPEASQVDASKSLTQQMMVMWLPPDPGRLHREYSSSELGEDVADFDQPFEEQSPERKSFINYEEADEA